METIHHSGPAYSVAFYRQPIRQPLHWQADHWPADPRGLRRPLWLSTKNCPTEKISQLQKPESKTDRFRMQILHARLHAPVCAGRRRAHAAEACRLRAARRAECASQDAPVARRKMRRLRVARRAGCAPQDAPVARRKTRGLHAGRRAACMPEDVPLARRKTCRERAVCAPNARRVRASGAGRPVWPFSSRSSLPDFRGRAAGGRRHARRGPQEHRASPALLRALARLEPKPGREKVPPGFSEVERKRSEAHKEARPVDSRVWPARVC